MSTPDTKLLERILKLHAKAESARAIGSEHEAAAFAAAVHKMLITANLELSEVEWRVRDTKDPVKIHWFSPGGKKRNIFWQSKMAEACAEAHLCVARTVTGSDHIVLIGRQENRRVVEYLLLTLFMTAEQLADAAYTAHFYHCKNTLGDATLARGFRKSFLIGFADRVTERYRAMIAEDSSLSQGSHALVRLNQEKQQVQEITDKVDEVIGTELVIDTTRVTFAGERAGRLAGDEVRLHANAVDGGTTHQAAVTSGQRLLGGGNG